MSTTVVVPSWNGRARLERLLPTLGDAAQVVVVDNGSRDGTSEMVARRFPDVDVLTLERNEGFSRAVNLAARGASGDVLVLVNDDCVCEPEFVGRLAAAVDPSRSLVMAAGVLLEAGRDQTIDSAGMELDDTLLVFDYLNGEPLTALDGAESPLGPCGAAAAFDRSAFLDVGGFDEHLFAYWEDVDLVLRLRLAGADCTLAADAYAIHAHSSTLGSGSADKNYLTGFGRGYVLRKWRVLAGRRAPAVLTREAAICAAQLAFDRTAHGVRGRADGWRAAASVVRPGYPDAVVSRGRRGLIDELQRRAERRRRLREIARAA